MISHARLERILAVPLAGLAGYVDAHGFLELGGYFVSFMSGNSTRLGVGAGHGAAEAALPAAIIVLFVAGVIAGSCVGRWTGGWRQPAILVFVAALLALAALSDRLGMNAPAVVAMALAMGAENTVFARDGEVAIGLTYMTGTLVKLGQRIAAVFLEGDRRGWVWYLLMWLGLVVGTIAGALVHARMGLAGLVWAALGAAVLGAVLVLGPLGLTTADSRRGPTR